MRLDDVWKFEDLRVSQWFAVGTKLGGLEAVKSVLRGDKMVVLRDRPKALFDKNGRRILPEGFLSLVKDPSKDHSFGQVDRERLFQRVFQAERLMRLQKRLTFPDYVFTEAPSAWAKLKEDLDGFPIMNGLCLPVLVPEWCLGPSEELEGHKNLSCRESFSDCLFRTVSSLAAASPLSLKTCSRLRDKKDFEMIGRRDRLLPTDKSLPALFFPEALWGYSVNAAIEQMETLPPEFFLAGVYETCSAYIMYPDVLAVDSAPSLDAPGNFHRDLESSVPMFAVFMKKQNELYLDMCLGRNHLANDNVSSGLIYYREI